jgi:hypothetical protein
MSISFASAELPIAVANHTAAAGFAIEYKTTRLPSCDQQALSLQHQMHSCI